MRKSNRRLASPRPRPSKTAERKQRTRQLIEAGGRVDMASLLELEPNALYGALLSLGEHGDKAQLQKWTALGRRTFDREAKAHDAGRAAVVLTFRPPCPATPASPCAPPYKPVRSDGGGGSCLTRRLVRHP